MKLIFWVTACVALAAGHTGAPAQFVKGNQAVQLGADGSKQVETPPPPRTGLAAPCAAARVGCAASGWRMVETADGLRECTEVFARPTTCRASTYGTDKRSRVWVVKSNGQWLQCQRPDLGSKCVSIKALPFSAVQ